MPDPNQWKPRELEILQLLAEGLTNAEIGRQLFLAHDTVRWYNKTIFGKLDVRNRTEAVKRANELGLLGSKAPSQTINKSPVRYVQNDGIHIAYQVVGEGPVDLLFIHGFISHLEVAWENPEFTNFFEQLGKLARVILFDKRGVGLSDRIQGAPTLENTVTDAIHVLDAAASKRTFVLGTSEGAAAAVLLASTYPSRVAGINLYGATPKVIRSEDKPDWAVSPEDFDSMIERMQKSWGGPWAVENFAPSRAKDETFRTWWAKVLKSASSPSSIKDVFNLIRLVDIRGLLPQIQVKTLVIHKTEDRMVRIEAGRYFADNMPNAEWLELPGSDHVYFVDAEGILFAVKKFFDETPDLSPSETCISTILHAKFSSDTRLPANLASEIRSFRARHLSISEHELTVTFDSPSRAIQFAARLRNISAKGIKVSLHVGECYMDSGRPTPYTADISRKATGLASEGEILITQTLHDILAGSRLQLRQNTEEAILPDEMVLYTLI